MTLYLSSDGSRGDFVQSGMSVLLFLQGVHFPGSPVFPISLSIRSLEHYSFIHSFVSHSCRMNIRSCLPFWPPECRLRPGPLRCSAIGRWEWGVGVCRGVLPSVPGGCCRRRLTGPRVGGVRWPAECRRVLTRRCWVTSCLRRPIGCRPALLKSREGAGLGAGDWWLLVRLRVLRPFGTILLPTRPNPLIKQKAI